MVGGAYIPSDISIIELTCFTLVPIMDGAHVVKKNVISFDFGDWMEDRIFSGRLH